MPRPAARAITTPSSLPTQTLPDNLLVLRRQWKWAAFCQFFVIFAPLFAVDDVTVTDVENDLVHSTSVVLPRIMQRLLYCLSYDRKVSLDNWQTALRKQYFKRDPQANPIGGEPRQERYSKSVEPAILSPAPKSEPDDPTEVRGSDDADAATTAPVFHDNDFATPDYHTLQRTSEVRQTSDYTAEDAKDWLQLSMLEKLDSLHLLTEWQFQNPTRLRQIMKSDDEAATWRIEPIGFDSKRNAYWLIGEDRLWVQRCPPRPSLKRKRPPAKINAKMAQGTKRTRLEQPKRSPLALNPSSHAIGDQGRTGRGGGRAAKAQAKLKLDAQARELAELNRRAAASTKGSPRKTRGNAPSSPPTPSRLPGRSVSSNRPAGTRLSLRLRGSLADEWQSVPEEWLQEPAQPEKNGYPRKTGLESDVSSVSDLTELSEETTLKEEEPSATEDQGQNNEAGSPPETNPPNNEADETVEDDTTRGEPTLPADFVEWETIAVTLEEWEHVADPFVKATHYSEKALFKVLNSIIPIVTEQLREIEKKRRMEEAVTHRKRSSRIALRESEKEEARLASKKRAEEEEKLSRARRAEARQLKEEAERQKRENARELRRKEREAKEEAQRKAKERVPSEADKFPGHNTDGIQLHLPQQSATNGSGSGSRTPNSDWELDCEICHRRGINIDDGVPMMSCGSCCKWQHISCHDRADHAAGRPKRNWDVVEFFCQKCQTDRNRNGQQSLSYPSASSNGVVPVPTLQLSAPYLTNGTYVPKAPSAGIVPYPSLPIPPNHYQQNPYATQTPITFSHYQPQQRVFTPSQIHQPYGSPVTHSYGMRMNGQVHHRPAQAWDSSNSTHAPGPYSVIHGLNSERSGVTPAWRETQPNSSEPAAAQNPWHPTIPQPHNQLTSQSQFYPT